MKNDMFKEKIETFFSKREKLISLFLAVEKLINSLGPVRIEVKRRMN